MVSIRAVSEESAGLNFARKQLEKHGWTEGKGLGKDESGIANAVKVGVKNDTLGVGFDVGKEFTNHWWDCLFNKAASNIVVEESKNGVQVSKKQENDSTGTNKTWRAKEKDLYYGRFVKANGDNASEPARSDPEVPKKFSDEELFQACGGRTAHKSARHGHKFSGKLKRVAEQEDEGNAKKKTKKDSKEKELSIQDPVDDIPCNEEITKNPKRLDRKRKCDKKQNINEVLEVNALVKGEADVENNESDNTSVKRRKREKKLLKKQKSKQDCERHSEDEHRKYLKNQNKSNFVEVSGVHRSDKKDIKRKKTKKKKKKQ